MAIAAKLRGGRAKFPLACSLLLSIRMSEPQWSIIPTKLKAKGFSVFYDRVSYAPEHPLWCAKANRNGRQWSTFGKNLPTALLELERQTQEAA